MKNLRKLALGLSAMLLAACSTTTPYQPASQPGAFDGYTDTMLENNRARVTFGGNSLTDRETVENYLLYRSAQLTVERGFDFFTLVERDVEENKRLQVSPGAYGPGYYNPYFGYSFYRPGFGWSGYYPYDRFYSPYYGRRRGWGFMGYSDPFFNDYDVREVTKYRAVAEVKFSRGVKPDNPNSFDAREVLANLGPSIVYPEDQN